jgi:hypothetical protein
MLCVKEDAVIRHTNICLEALVLIGLERRYYTLDPVALYANNRTTSMSASAICQRCAS